MRADRPVAGLLLTGGTSRRMGRPKATLQFGGQTLAERAAGALKEVCRDVVLEVGPGYTDLACVREDPPLTGPLAAIAAGGVELQRLGCRQNVLVLAVDMPFVTGALLAFIAAHGDAQKSAIPVAEQPQPLCARYSPAALGAARRLSADGRRSMNALLSEIPIDWIEEPEWGKVAGMDAFSDLDDQRDLLLMEQAAAEARIDDPPRRSTRRVEMLAVDGSGVKRRTDTLAAEEPMEIRVSGPGHEPVPVAITMRTPGHDFELAAGFLFTEGLVRAGEIASVKYCEIPAGEQEYNVITVKLNRPFDRGPLQRNFYANSSCGICGKATLEQIEVHCPHIAPGPVFGRAAILAMPAALAKGQRLFEKTGGLHAAGSFDPSGNLIAVREDIGRHNAVDKLIGQAVLSRQLPLSQSGLMVSGRLSFEIVQKAAVAGVPLVAAVSAPSSLAVEAARSLGVTLAGFVRGDRFNLYTHPERVDLEGHGRA